MTEEAPDPKPRQKKREDTAEGCRSMAKDDHNRAEASDTDHMRSRLACSADAWTKRADMLDRLKASARRGGQSEAGKPSARRKETETTQ
jgi:hypothetical protein